ncbi:response regulator [Candidatus Marithrix sp. Canyon 246]|uniref:response regulator n=1 Tax=Candidatus Marithrix sp. Canyon 246 TaxID=1827136 RepID=UPI000849F99F|nr:response regulator [Candidatus Marithrix sp. Canyon 246]
MQDETSTILIVDDIAENISVLFDLLIMNDFEVLVERSGEGALQLVELACPRPDLILLDVMMPPGIDGFETCSRLKANPNTEDITVIFMTALSDTTDKVRGFELGGMDYVTKPFQQEEVLARINTHLTISKLKKQFANLNSQIKIQDEKLQQQYAMTSSLNDQLQKEIRERKHAEKALQASKRELNHAINNLNRR